MGIIQALSIRQNFVIAKRLSANGAITGGFRNVPAGLGKRIGDIGTRPFINVWDTIKAAVLYAPVVSTVRLFNADGFQTAAAERYFGVLSLGFVSGGSKYDPPNENSECHRYNLDTEQYSRVLSLGFVSGGSRYDPPNENSECHRYNNNDISLSYFTSCESLSAHDRYVFALRDMGFSGLPIIWQNILKVLHLK